MKIHPDVYHMSLADLKQLENTICAQKLRGEVDDADFMRAHTVLLELIGQKELEEKQKK